MSASSMEYVGAWSEHGVWEHLCTDILVVEPIQPAPWEGALSFALEG